MCDISHEENKAIHTQVIMSKLNLNQDVMNIINSFIFYDKNEYTKIKLQKMYKKTLMNSLKNMVKYEQHLSYNSWHWSFVFNYHINIDDEKDILFNIQGINCYVCGRYSMTTLDNPNKYIYCNDEDHVYSDNCDMYDMYDIRHVHHTYETSNPYKIYNQNGKRLHHQYGNYQKEIVL